MIGLEEYKTFSAKIDQSEATYFPNWYMEVFPNGGVAPYSYQWDINGNSLPTFSYNKPNQGVALTGPTNQKTQYVELPDNSIFALYGQLRYCMVRCIVTDATGNKCVAFYQIYFWTEG